MALTMTPAEKLEAIHARINGIWDNVQLMKLGPLGDTKFDIKRILNFPAE